MRESLKPGSEIDFKEKSFFIESLLSEDGSSCLVYIAFSYDMLGQKHFSVLKQLFPIGLDIKLHSNKLSILVPEKSSEMFEVYKNKFKEAYLKQVSSQNIEESGNKLSIALGIYEGYNTLFIEMQYDRGYCYNNVKQQSLQEIFKITKAISETIKIMYHDKGLLHLDIKPANIFILKETTDYIKVFDFDSVVSKKDLAIKNQRLSFSQRWAAPELLLDKRQEICEATDIYSIGAIVFNQIFKKTPVSKDIRYDSKYDFTKNKLFENINPTIYNPLTEFFHKTLQATPFERYQSIEELMFDLNKLIIISNPINVYLSNHNFSSSPQFIGRRCELQIIKEKLNTNGYCFIYGMGGIGKTEIAKQFAINNRNYYHTIHVIKYSGDLKKDIINMDFVNIDNKAFLNEKGEIDVEKLYKFKRDRIQELDKKTLIIVDNFNTNHDPFLGDIISNNKHHTLFTTKNIVFQKSQYYVEIKELSPENSLKLFYSFYKCPSEDTIINNIINQVQKNTLAIKLIASTMEKIHISPRDMLEKLQKGIKNDIAVRINHNRDILEQNIENETLFNHLCIVFNTAKLPKEQKYLLMNMYFVSQYEITDKAFLNLLQIDYTNDMINFFNALLEQNWIYIDNETNVVSLHPIVSAVVKVQLQPDIYNCSQLIKNIIQTLFDNNYELLNSKQKISLGEEILKQNQIPKHLLSQIYYGLSYQFGTNTSYINKALKYGEKAENSYCRLKNARKSIKDYNTLIFSHYDLSIKSDSPSKLKYHSLLDKPKFDDGLNSYNEEDDFYNYKSLKILILKNLAVLYFNIKQYKNSLKYLKRIGNSPDTLFLAGKCQYYVGDYDNALSIFENTLLKYGYSQIAYEETIINKFSIFSKITELLSFEDNEDLPPIIEILSISDASECLRWIAYCYNKKGNREQSLHCGELLKKLIQDNKISKYEYNMLLADIFEINGEYNEANRIILESKNGCSSLEELNMVIFIAENNMKAKNFCESLLNWKKASEISEVIYDKSNEINFKIGINTGDCYFQINNYADAKKCYEELYEIFQDDDYRKMLISKKLSKIYVLQNNMDLSEKNYDFAISLAIDILGEKTIEVSDLYYEKSQLYIENDENKAIEYLEKCLDIRKCLLHIEDKKVIICQQELLKLYQKKNNKEKIKPLNKQIRKSNSKVDILMTVSFLTFILSSLLYSIFIDSSFNPLVNPINTVVLVTAYSVGIILFSLTFKLNIEKFTNNFSGTLIIFGAAFLSLILQYNIMGIIYQRQSFMSLDVQKIITLSNNFNIENSFCMLPLIILSWFTAYNAFLNKKTFKIILSLIFTLFFALLSDSITLGIFLILFSYFLLRNNKEKWLQPNNMDISILLSLLINLSIFIFLYALISIKHNIFVNIESPIPILQSLNLFTQSPELSMMNLKNYPILNLMMHNGIFIGLLILIIYFIFAIHSMKNAKRIKSVYKKTVYETICLFFLLTGALNILYAIIDIISQSFNSKILLVRTVLFPFLSPNPLFLISSFFLSGILFSIYYNRTQE